MEWNRLADKGTVEKTMAALKENGMEVFFVASGAEAKAKALSVIPKSAEVMDMTSTTLGTIGVADAINKSGDYDSVRNRLNGMDRNTQGSLMQKLGAAPDWTVGSVHAVTEKGQVMVVSQTGSQLPAYAYGSGNVVWVVGTQKIVKDLDDGFRRIYEYVLPLESERARKAYGVPGSAVNKVLIVNKEVRPGRLRVIFVNEALGF